MSALNALLPTLHVSSAVNAAPDQANKLACTPAARQHASLPALRPRVAKAPDTQRTGVSNIGTY